MKRKDKELFDDKVSSFLKENYDIQAKRADKLTRKWLDDLKNELAEQQPMSPSYIVRPINQARVELEIRPRCGLSPRECLEQYLAHHDIGGSWAVSAEPKKTRGSVEIYDATRSAAVGGGREVTERSSTQRSPSAEETVNKLTKEQKRELLKELEESIAA